MRLIDGNRLVKETMPQYKELMGTDIGHDMGMMLAEINAAPTIDAVPVVRCEDCKYHNKAPCPMRLSFNWTNDNDFCSYGERKENNND